MKYPRQPGITASLVRRGFVCLKPNASASINLISNNFNKGFRAYNDWEAMISPVANAVIIALSFLKILLCSLKKHKTNNKIVTG